MSLTQAPVAPRLAGTVEADLSLWSSADGQLGIHLASHANQEVTVLPHSRPAYNLIFCLSGTVEIFVEGQSEMLRRASASSLALALMQERGRFSRPRSHVG